jgi:DNA-binding NtrC family response regulator
MKCNAVRMGPRHAAPTPGDLSPLVSGSSRPTRSIPYLVARAEHLERVSSIAASLGYEFVRIDSLDEFQEHLRAFPATMVWTDSHLHDGSWRDVLSLCREQSPELPVVVLAMTDSPALWEEANQEGVAEFLAPPFAAPEVRRCLLSLASAVESTDSRPPVPAQAAV